MNLTVRSTLAREVLIEALSFFPSFLLSFFLHARPYGFDLSCLSLFPFLFATTGYGRKIPKVSPFSYYFSQLLEPPPLPSTSTTHIKSVAGSPVFSSLPPTYKIPTLNKFSGGRNGGCMSPFAFGLYIIIILFVVVFFLFFPWLDNTRERRDSFVWRFVRCLVAI